MFFHAAIIRFDAGERVPFPCDRVYLRMQGLMGQRFSEAYLPPNTLPASFHDLDYDYQKVFALYWDCREAKG